MRGNGGEEGQSGKNVRWTLGQEAARVSVRADRMTQYNRLAGLTVNVPRRAYGPGILASVVAPSTVSGESYSQLHFLGELPLKNIMSASSLAPSWFLRPAGVTRR